MLPADRVKPQTIQATKYNDNDALTPNKARCVVLKKNALAVLQVVTHD
jgi:hypothetical protein